MKREDVIERLIDEKFSSKRQFAEHIGLPPTTLQSILKRGIGKSSIDNVIRICRGLGITVEDLEKMANQQDNHLHELSKKERVKAISDFFGMSIEELLSKTESEKFSAAEEKLHTDSGKLSLEELKTKHTLTIDGRPATDKEINAIISFVRSIREYE